MNLPKPKWRNAPEWAQYVAKDLSGIWYWYENEPNLNGNCWMAYGKQSVVFEQPHRDFLFTLEERP